MTTPKQGADVGGNVGSGRDYYTHMDANAYATRINTPARNPDYYRRFHQPVITRAVEQASAHGSRARLLDIACGPATELDFVRDDFSEGELGIFATDISQNILSEAKARLGDRVAAFTADVRSLPIQPGAIDAGILVNAVVYHPEAMIGAMAEALRPGGQCVANFRIHANPHNDAFYDHYTERGGQLTTTDEERRVELDYRTCMTDEAQPDLAIRALGVQTYFTSVELVRQLIAGSGLVEVGHDTFDFASPVNPHNQIDVFTLEKPQI